MFVFQKIWCVLFSCNIRFEILSFPLLPTNYRYIEGIFLYELKRGKHLPKIAELNHLLGQTVIKEDQYF